eukprot:scaffold119605_cov23-Tisochrysis_lutea.AAC.3
MQRTCSCGPCAASARASWWLTSAATKARTRQRLRQRVGHQRQHLWQPLQQQQRRREDRPVRVVWYCGMAELPATRSPVPQAPTR